MPTALRVGPYSFYFFSHEPDEPPHVHVDRDDQSAKFWLDPVALTRNFGFRAHDPKNYRRQPSTSAIFLAWAFWHLALTSGSGTLQFPRIYFPSSWKTEGPYPYRLLGFRDSFMRPPLSAAIGGAVPQATAFIGPTLTSISAPKDCYGVLHPQSERCPKTVQG
jgi:hypothetical protein